MKYLCMLVQTNVKISAARNNQKWNEIKTFGGQKYYNENISETQVAPYITINHQHDIAHSGVLIRQDRLRA